DLRNKPPRCGLFLHARNLHKFVANLEVLDALARDNCQENVQRVLDRCGSARLFDQNRERAVLERDLGNVNLVQELDVPGKYDQALLEIDLGLDLLGLERIPNLQKGLGVADDADASFLLALGQTVEVFDCVGSAPLLRQLDLVPFGTGLQRRQEQRQGYDAR